jgi:predicted nucleic acid-binding protein
VAGYVIDASVLVEVFVAGPAHEACMRFLEHAASSGFDLCAPDAIYYEVAGALRRHELRSDYSSMGDDIGNLSDLDVVTTSDKELLIPAVEIARQHTIGIYDAFYLALSQRLAVPLVTVDKRLVNAVVGKPFQVIFAGDLVT